MNFQGNKKDFAIAMAYSMEVYLGREITAFVDGFCGSLGMVYGLRSNCQYIGIDNDKTLIEGLQWFSRDDALNLYWSVNSILHDEDIPYDEKPFIPKCGRDFINTFILPLEKNALSRATEWDKTIDMLRLKSRFTLIKTDVFDVKFPFTYWKEDAVYYFDPPQQNDNWDEFLSLVTNLANGGKDVFFTSIEPLTDSDKFIPLMTTRLGTNERLYAVKR